MGGVDCPLLQPDAHKSPFQQMAVKTCGTLWGIAVNETDVTATPQGSLATQGGEGINHGSALGVC